VEIRTPRLASDLNANAADANTVATVYLMMGQACARFVATVLAGEIA
jgi:hypothetical protein